MTSFDLLDIVDVPTRWEPSVIAIPGQIDLARAEVLADLLGVEPPAFGDPVSPLWHEAFLREAPLLSRLGPDGHPRASGLLPPIRNRRRMFGGSEVRIVAPLHVGEIARRTVEVVDVRLKSGSTGDLLVVTEAHCWHAGESLKLTETRNIIYKAEPEISRPPRPAPVASALIHR